MKKMSGKQEDSLWWLKACLEELFADEPVSFRVCERIGEIGAWVRTGKEFDDERDSCTFAPLSSYVYWFLGSSSEKRHAFFCFLYSIYDLLLRGKNGFVTLKVKAT
jgi:hypothetical protein